MSAPDVTTDEKLVENLRRFADSVESLHRFAGSAARRLGWMVPPLIGSVQALQEAATRIDQLSRENLDTRTALQAPELHWDCQKRLDDLEAALDDRRAFDLSDAHVDRLARHLFRAFDDVNIGREPLHDFDVTIEERGDHWHALAREAIRLGAVLAKKEIL